MEKGNVLMTVIAVVCGVLIMIVFPLMAVSDTQDDISQVAVQSLVAEFVNKEATKGKVTLDDYNEFISKLYATGNTYEVQLEHKIMTTNPNKGAADQLGENLYYSVYDPTILDGSSGVNNTTTGEYLMKKGDYFICTVKNTNTTIASQLKNWAYSIVGKDTYTIAASGSALVVNTGSYAQ